MKEKIILGTSDASDESFVPATQHIILKIVRFQNTLYFSRNQGNVAKNLRQNVNMDIWNIWTIEANARNVIVMNHVTIMNALWLEPNVQ